MSSRDREDDPRSREQATKHWFEIDLSVPADRVDLATLTLAEAGYESSELRQDSPDTVSLVVCTNTHGRRPATETAGELAAMLARGGDVSFTVREVGETWRENWKQHFPRTRIGRRLLVVPPWEQPDDADAGRVVVKINPGMAFGTGQHETTAACLEMIDRLVQSGFRVADVGCGSGLLAIAALRLGASSVFATDDDPQAVEAARQNAILNGTDDRLRIELRSGPPTSGTREEQLFDLVLANIYAETLVKMRVSLTSCVKGGGYLVLSGIEASRRSVIEERFVSDAWPLVEATEVGEWVTITVRRSVMR